ncbi:hypothetical protein [Xylophilus sp.]|uniref:hypothetical protein n=1 Tax=Xylophilus sp. TaxID=2653893 RepID=UPI0013B8D9D5|nr:hypothetical protein [Xylophilus sp.]KAF1050201.1 MAG: hypothetical protein GAK38_00227 [Xylophilus sp.]
MTQHLFARSWLRAWQGLAARGDGRAVQSALLAAYAEPHRRYHTQQHLAECLQALAHAALAQGFGWVMLYGGIAAWITAALSWGVFGRRRAASTCASGA